MEVTEDNFLDVMFGSGGSNSFTPEDSTPQFSTQSNFNDVRHPESQTVDLIEQDIMEAKAVLSRKLLDEDNDNVSSLESNTRENIYDSNIELSHKSVSSSGKGPSNGKAVLLTDERRRQILAQLASERAGRRGFASERELNLQRSDGRGKVEATIGRGTSLERHEDGASSLVPKVASIQAAIESATTAAVSDALQRAFESIGIASSDSKSIPLNSLSMKSNETRVLGTSIASNSDNIDTNPPSSRTQPVHPGASSSYRYSSASGKADSPSGVRGSTRALKASGVSSPAKASSNSRSLPTPGSLEKKKRNALVDSLLAERSRKVESETIQKEVTARRSEFNQLSSSSAGSSSSRQDSAHLLSQLAAGSPTSLVNEISESREQSEMNRTVPVQFMQSFENIGTTSVPTILRTPTRSGSQSSKPIVVQPPQSPSAAGLAAAERILQLGPGKRHSSSYAHLGPHVTPRHMQPVTTVIGTFSNSLPPSSHRVNHSPGRNANLDSSRISGTGENFSESVRNPPGKGAVQFSSFVASSKAQEHADLLPDGGAVTPAHAYRNSGIAHSTVMISSPPLGRGAAGVGRRAASVHASTSFRPSVVEKNIKKQSTDSSTVPEEMETVIANEKSKPVARRSRLDALSKERSLSLEQRKREKSLLEAKELEECSFQPNKRSTSRISSALSAPVVDSDVRGSQNKPLSTSTYNHTLLGASSASLSQSNAQSRSKQSVHPQDVMGTLKHPLLSEGSRNETNSVNTSSYVETLKRKKELMQSQPVLISSSNDNAAASSSNVSTSAQHTSSNISVPKTPSNLVHSSTSTPPALTGSPLLWEKSLAKQFLSRNSQLLKTYVPPSSNNTNINDFAGGKKSNDDNDQVPSQNTHSKLMQTTASKQAITHSARDSAKNNNVSFQNENEKSVSARSKSVSNLFSSSNVKEAARKSTPNLLSTVSGVVNLESKGKEGAKKIHPNPIPLSTSPSISKKNSPASGVVPSVVSRLYEDASVREAKRAAAVRSKEKHESKEFPFSPHVPTAHISNAAAPTQPVHVRTQEYARDAEERLRNARIRALEEDKNLTFQPHINPVSAQIAAERAKRVGVPVGGVPIAIPADSVASPPNNNNYNNSPASNTNSGSIHTNSVVITHLPASVAVTHRLTSESNLENARKQRNRLEIMNSQLSECTFQPKISARTNALAEAHAAAIAGGRASFLERQEREQAESRLRKEEIMRKTDELNQCTFAPNIGASEAILAVQRPEIVLETAAERVKRLANEKRARNEQLEAVRKELYKDETFHPRINDISRRIARAHTVTELADVTRPGKLKQQAQAKVEAEFQQSHTFQPQISGTSRAITQKLREQGDADPRVAPLVDPVAASERIKAHLAQKLEDELTSKRLMQYEELKDCTFSPDIELSKKSLQQSTAAAAENGGVVVVRGLGRHLELHDLRRKQKMEQEERMKAAFTPRIPQILRDHKGPTVPKPFRLSTNLTGSANASLEQAKGESDIHQKGDVSVMDTSHIPMHPKMRRALIRQALDEDSDDHSDSEVIGNNSSSLDITRF